MYIFTVASFKGGTAKTSTCLHVGAALAKFHKKKVLLVDFDAQANLTLGLGFDPDVHESLAKVLQGEKEIQSVVQSTGIRNLDLIPADTWLERIEVSGNLASDRYSHEKLKKVLKGLSYDFIIIDTPPSLCWLTESALIASTHSLVCATPEFYSIKGLERLAQFMYTLSERHPTDVLGVILSFWNTRGKNNKAFLDVIDRTFPNICFSTKIRRDVYVAEASVFGRPIFELPKAATQSRALQDYQELTKEILDRLKSTSKKVLKTV